MKYLLTFLAFVAVVLVLSIALHGADGVLQNVSGTTSTGGSVPISQFLTNNQSSQVMISNNLQVAVPFRLSFPNGAGTTSNSIYSTDGFTLRFAQAGTDQATLNNAGLLNISSLGIAGATTISSTKAGFFDAATTTNGYAWAGTATIVTLTNIVYTNVTLDFGSTATLSFSDLLVNVQTLKSNDVCTINPPAIAQTNGVFTAWVSNTVLYARYNNYAATAINPASGIFNIQVFQYK